MRHDPFREHARLNIIRRRARSRGLSHMQVADLVMRGPDEAERRLSDAPRLLRLKDLTRAERLRATCTGVKCRHWGWVDINRQRWGHLTLQEIAARLRCQECGARKPKLEVGPGWPRD
ncbi:hypothetical protein QFZ27_001872 [Inquilinus ginsengisoli]